MTTKKMAIQEASSKLLIVMLVLIKLTSGEQNVNSNNNNKPDQTSRLLTKRQNEKDFPPRLTHQPHSVRAKPHEPLTVECPVESQPESEVKWFKDGQVLTSEPAHLEQTGSELMFFQTRVQDTGDYHCEAENHLGRVASERFRLTVQSNTIQDESILMEPQVYLAADQQEWPAEFRCTIPVLLLGRVSKLWQTSRPEQFVKWHRNGRALSVLWEPSNNSNQQQQQDSTTTNNTMTRAFKAHQSDRMPNEFVLRLSRPVRQFDDNSTFTCLLKWDDEAAGEIAVESYESRPSLLKFEPEPVKLNIPMGQPMGDLANGLQPNDINNNNNPLTMQTLDRGLSRETNQTTHLTGSDGDDGGQTRQKQPATGQIRLTLVDTLRDLYQIAKPTLILFGIMSLVAVIVLLQYLFMRRRAQAHRYMKHHHQYSSSASSANSGLCPGGGGSGTSSALGDCDPVLSSLLARTLSAPSAGSLSGASKKYKYYRDNMRGKVAAAVASDHQLVEGAHHDFIDAAAYFAATHQQQQQQQDCQASLFASNNSNNHNSAVPNLYNQSLAAREQARSLLQSGEHVRSMGNLTTSGQLQRLEHPLNKQHEMIMSGTQRPSQQQQQQQKHHHHLELPMNFANPYNGPLELGAASLLQQHQPLLNTQSQLWHGQQHLLLAAAAQNQQQQQHQHHKQANSSNEQYQLVSCSSISPSSTSSTVAGSNSSSGTAAAGNHNQQEETSTTTNSKFKSSVLSAAATTRDSISNHYSVIENNDDELDGRGRVEADEEDEERYEELDDREFHRSSARSSCTSSSVGQRKLTTSCNSHQENGRDFNRKTTFGVDTVTTTGNNVRQSQRKSASQLRSSIISNESSSSSSGGSGGPSDNLRRTKGFGSKRASSSSGKTNQRKSNQDQLSPYAVSSICHSQPPPPPVSSEAMRALNEQFDISQLVLIDNSRQSSGMTGQQAESAAPRMPFNLPPPPPAPSAADCEAMSSMLETMANGRSTPQSKTKRTRQ